MTEARITINGTPLTEAQSITLRVAVTQWHNELQDPAERELLGVIGPLYRDRPTELLALIIPERQAEFWVCEPTRGGPSFAIKPGEVDDWIAKGGRVYRQSAPARMVDASIRIAP